MARDVRLADYEQDVQIVRGNAAYDVRVYEGGVDPILVKRPKVPAIVTQSGQATTWYGRMEPPAPIFPASVIDQAQESHKSMDGLRWTLTWTWVMAIEDSAVEPEWINAARLWPEGPLTLST